MTDHDDEPTAEVLPLTDEQLLEAHRARQRLEARMAAEHRLSGDAARMIATLTKERST